jgi:hypothetical protein
MFRSPSLTAPQTTISRERRVMREKSQGGAFPVCKGSDAIPV